jgi:hypothetical protein
MGVAVLRTTTQRNGSTSEGLISMCMNEIAGLRTRNELTVVTPTDLANAREDVGDRLLLSVMVNAGPRSRFHGPRSRFHLEQAAPDGGCNAERGGDSGAPFRTGVCAVPVSNSAGLTMWIAAGELIASGVSLATLLQS